MITQADLRGIVSYDPETGKFTWIKKIASKVIVGAEAGCHGGDGYMRLRIDGIMYLSHRLVWLYVYGEWPEIIDHINGNRSDNRIINLRSVNKSQNAMNAGKHRDNASGHKGVYWDAERGKWQVSICKNGRSIHVGRFSDKQEAIDAHARASADHHGEYGKD